MATYLRRMRRHTNSWARVAKQHTVTSLNDMQRVWIRWFLGSIECKSLHTGASCRWNNFSASVPNETAPLIKKDRSYVIKSLRSVILRNVMFELSLGDYLSPESDIIGCILKIFPSHAVKVLLHLVTEMVVQAGQPYASPEIVLAVVWSGYVSGAVFPSLKDYDEERNMIRNVFVAENTNQRVFASEKFGSNKAMINSFFGDWRKSGRHFWAVNSKGISILFLKGAGRPFR